MKRDFVLLIWIFFLSGCKKEEVPSVTTVSVINISSTSATCVGKINSTGYIRFGGICWSNILKEPTDFNDGDFDFVQGTGISLPMRNLTPGTTYYVRAYATNFVGTGYGDAISFKTTGNVTGDIVFHPDLTYNSVSDILGNTYKTVKIGSQIWMAENLKATKYNDGTDIPNVTDLAEWHNLITPAYCWYVNDAAQYRNTYGALYNWYTINTGKLCPIGWHVPSNIEWTTLCTYLGGDTIAYGKLREVGTTHWIYTNTEVTNSSGFSALPGGRHTVGEGPPKQYFLDMGYDAVFWTSTLITEGSISAGFHRWFLGQYSQVGEANSPRGNGYSVRCIND
jgi:uncharacterized protein (TIGR02145 family)